MAMGGGECEKALNEVPGFLLKAPGVGGRREQSLSQAWTQCARPPPSWMEAGFTSAPTKGSTHLLALSAPTTLLAGVCDGAFHTGGSRLREVRCLSGDSASGWPALAHGILPPTLLRALEGEESGERDQYHAAKEPPQVTAS